MSTINSLPIPNGTLSSKNVGGGTRCWVGECSVDGTHVLSCRIAIARSHIGLEKASHALGHGVPPKVRGGGKAGLALRLEVVCSIGLRWQRIGGIVGRPI